MSSLIPFRCGARPRSPAVAAAVLLSLAAAGIATAQVRSKIKISAMPDPNAAAAFSPDGSLLVTVGRGGDPSTSEARVWDTVSGKLLWKRPISDPTLASKALPPFSSDGKLVAVTVVDWDRGNASIELIDSRKGVVAASVRGYPVVPSPRAIFMPDGKTLVTALADPRSGEGLIRLEDVATGKTRKSVSAGKGRWITQIAVAPDGRTLVTVSGATFHPVPVRAAGGSRVLVSSGAWAWAARASTSACGTCRREIRVRR